MALNEFEWKGEKVRKDTLFATRLAMDGLMSDCVIASKQRVPKRTTILQGSIRMQPTREEGENRLVGYWGSFSTEYAIFVETGTRPHMPPVSAIEKSMKVSRDAAWMIALSIKKYGTRPHPYLLPVADEKYPSLGLRIQMQIGARA